MLKKARENIKTIYKRSEMCKSKGEESQEESSVQRLKVNENKCIERLKMMIKN